MRHLNRLALVAAAAFCLAGAAQAAGPGVQTDKNCKTTLPPTQGRPQATAKPDDDLSQSLADCRGVLKPPSVGDDMTVPPPQTSSKTPVLPPESVPKQTPKGGSG